MDEKIARWAIRQFLQAFQLETYTIERAEDQLFAFCLDLIKKECGEMNTSEKKAMWDCIEHLYDCINLMNQEVDSSSRVARICESLSEVFANLDKYQKE